MKYCLPTALFQATERFFSDCGIVRYDIRRTYSELSPGEAMELCCHDLSAPLFLEDKEAYFKYQNNILFLPELRRRLAFLEEVTFSDDEYLGWGLDREERLQDLQVFSGLPVISYLKGNIFEVDYAAYGFEYFEDFVFSVSAHILNLYEGNTRYSDFQWTTEINGKLYRNMFSRYIHGDFRFTQLDITPQLCISPFNDSTMIRVPEEKTMSGYHSVECMFFATVLRYAMELKIDLPAMDNYQDLIFGILESGCVLGNFADAGCKSWFSESYLLTREIPLIGTAPGRNPHSIPKEESGHESAFRDGAQLVFQPSGVRFGPDDVNRLIIALHKACQEGFGRTSIGNLIEFHQNIVQTFYEGIGLVESELHL